MMHPILAMGKFRIYLKGPEGNAFYILGVARQLAVKNNKDPKAIQMALINMDYQPMLKLFLEQLRA